MMQEQAIDTNSSGRCPEPGRGDWGLKALALDLRRKREHYTRIDNFVNRYIKMTLQWGSLAVMMYRCQQQLANVHLGPLRWLLMPLLALLAGVLRLFNDITIDPRADIGAGLVVHNFSGIQLSPACAGRNLTVNQNVYIGRGSRDQGRPVLGANVFVGSGAKIIGNVRVGNNVVIAANALVNKSIPDNCSVVGVPARVVSTGVTSDYLNFSVN